MCKRKKTTHCAWSLCVCDSLVANRVDEAEFERLLAGHFRVSDTCPSNFLHTVFSSFGKDGFDIFLHGFSGREQIIEPPRIH